MASSIAYTFHFGLPSLHTDIFSFFLENSTFGLFLHLHAPSPPCHSVHSWKESKRTDVSPSGLTGCHISKAEPALVGAGAGQALPRVLRRMCARESESRQDAPRPADTHLLKTCCDQRTVILRNCLLVWLFLCSL